MNGKQNMVMVEFLVEHGCDVEVRDREGRTGLFAAVAVGHSNIVEYLVDQGADVRIQDRKGLMVSVLLDVLEGNKTIVQYLSEHGCEEGMDGAEEEEEEGYWAMCEESVLYQFLMRYYHIPSFTAYYCDECGKCLMEHENRYHCLECTTFHLCPYCSHKTEFQNAKGYLTTHQFEITAAK